MELPEPEAIAGQMILAGLREKQLGKVGKKTTPPQFDLTL